MSRTATRLAVLLLSTATSIWGTPAAAQQADPTAALITATTCTGDYVCTDDPSVVATWPLERWAHVRRQSQQAKAAQARRPVERLSR